MDVLVLSWPGDAEEAKEAALNAVPRLLLLGPDTPPPRVIDHLEDWIRLPATDADLDARIESLRVRNESRPTIAGDVVTFGGSTTALSPVESALLSALLEKQGAVVYRDALARAAWPGGRVDRNALDAAIRRLRRRLDGTGVTITTVRGRGYMAGTGVQAQTSDSCQEFVVDA